MIAAYVRASFKKVCSKNLGFASPLYIIDEEQLEKQRRRKYKKWLVAKNG
jgi:hypothetical protein